MKAVRFDRYGGDEVLEIRDLDPPTAEPEHVVVQVRAAAINPGEIKIREGVFAKSPSDGVPSGEGTDLAGEVVEVGDGVTGFAPGDQVIGWSEERSSHAELVSVPVQQLTPKPDAVPWEVAGALFVAPMAAQACVETVAPRAGETVVVSGAAGGVGSIAVQLARRAGATVIGLAGEANHDWLRAHDIVPIRYGDGQADRIRDAAGDGVDAVIDTFGGGYLDLGVELGVAPGRMNTIIDFDAAKRLGAHAVGSHDIGTAERLAELARLVAEGELEVPIAATFPLTDVRAAFRQIADRHTHGKVVLIP